MSSAEQPLPSSDLSNTLARSRSRYKGNRPNKVFTNHEHPPRIRVPQESPAQRAHHVHTRQRQPSDPQNVSRKAQDASQLDSRTRRDLAAENPTAKPRTDETPSRSRTMYRNQKSQPNYLEERDKISRPMARTVAEQICGRERRQMAQPEETEMSNSNPRPQERDPGILPPEYPRFRGEGAKERLPQRPVPQQQQQQQQQQIRPRIDTSHSEPARTATLHKRRPSKSKEELKKAISAPMAFQPPPMARKPAFDAPVSAVNAGERRVMVKYNETAMSLPVTPSTTTVEIIHAATVQLSKPIDPRSVVMESFKQLGLERPLRRYEHVRDVMNSWDHDQQNTLNIVPSPTGGRDQGLELRYVSPVQPGDTSVYVYHSQRPGTWDKRWVTLRADGQITIAKKDRRETFNICHLSDFDIYVPAAKHMKRIKPPKKICLAVKSQQKSAMFLTTENFVHFFSTSDKEIAASWNKAVQEWRSWYLVHVLGLGHSEENQPSHKPPSPRKHQSQPSSDSGPMQTLNPLMQTVIADSPPRRLPIRNRGPPPVSFPKRLTKDPNTGEATTHNPGPSILQTQSREVTEAETFAESGLLGRTYTQRRTAQQSRERAQALGQPVENPQSATAGESSSSGLRRQPSQRSKPKPLIDLSSSLHHTRSIKGRGPHSPPGGLVSAATNAAPEASASFEPVASMFARSKSVKRPGAGNPMSPADEDESAFTGGLLASHPQHQTTIAATGGGKGVRTGDRDAKQPLLTDLGLDPAYRPGSLLDRIKRESMNGADAGSPVIDREKRREIDVEVGEGL